MLDNLFIHTITVIRFSNTGQGTLGEFDSSSSTYDNGGNGIPCRIEGYDAELQYNEGGKRAVNKTIIYIPPQYILFEDDAIYQDGEYLGLVEGVNKALKANTTDLDHYEIILESK